jgi:hypothetical protein
MSSFMDGFLDTNLELSRMPAPDVDGHLAAIALPPAISVETQTEGVFDWAADDPALAGSPDGRQD